MEEMEAKYLIVLRKIVLTALLGEEPEGIPILVTVEAVTVMAEMVAK